MRGLAALACLLCLAAAGCGGGGEPSSTDAPPSIHAEEAASADQSIQRYGAEATGAEKAAILAAMRSYLGALANRDYVKICAGLSAANRAQLAQYAKLRHEAAKSCSSVTKALLAPGGAAEAKRAAAATVGRVRVDQGSAFVLFRPPGGAVSYFVMRREGGEWKATSLGAGAPLVAGASAGP